MKVSILSTSIYFTFRFVEVIHNYWTSLVHANHIIRDNASEHGILLNILGEQHKAIEFSETKKHKLCLPKKYQIWSTRENLSFEVVYVQNIL